MKSNSKVGAHVKGNGTKSLNTLFGVTKIDNTVKPNSKNTTVENVRLYEQTGKHMSNAESRKGQAIMLIRSIQNR